MTSLMICTDCLPVYTGESQNGVRLCALHAQAARAAGIGPPVRGCQ